MDSVNRKTQESVGLFGKATGAVGGMVSSLGSIGLAAGGIGAIVGAVSGVANAMISGNAEMEVYETQLGTLLGSTDAAKDRLAELAKFGAETPFELPELVRAEKVLIGFGLQGQRAFDLAGMSAEDLRTVVGDVAAGVGVPFEELAVTVGKFSTGATGEAISRMQELGIVTKEELAGMGISFDKGGSMTSPVDEALKATTTIMKEKFGGGMADLSATFEGKMSTLADTWGQIKRTLMEPLFDVAKAGLDAILPALGEFAAVLSESIPAAIELVRAAFSGDWTDAAAQAAAKFRDMFGTEIGMGIIHLVSMFGELGAAMKSLVAGDIEAFFDNIESAVYRALAAFEKLTGIDMTALITFMAGDDDGGPGAIDALSDAIITLSGWVTTIVEKLGGWSTVIGVVATALAAFSVITTVIGWVSGLMAAWASLGAGITAAGGIVGAIIAVLGGPLTIAIAAVAAIVAGLALAWKNDWGGMRDKVAEIVGWIQANVVPAIQAAFGQVQAVLSNLVAWWQANGAEVIAVVSGIVSFVVKQFEFLFTFLSNVVKAGIALITGDWRGLGEAVGAIIGNAIAAWVHMIRGLVSAVVAIFKGLWPAVKGAVSSGITGIISWLKGEGDKMGSMTLQGLIEGIKSGAGKVLTALKDLASGMVKGFMDSLVMHSPSKVFEQLGQWITIGLASGIQKEDQKAVAALADIIAKMSSVASGLADFGKKIAEMIVPSDQQIAAAKEKYLRMTMILTDFIKSISYLGALLPVANVSKAEPGQVRAINAGLTQLSQSFPAIKELQGMTADKLLTGGEASWASMLADTVGKIAGVWGGIADSMTKIATAKFPTDSQLQSIKESTIRIATWAMGVLDQPMITSLGAEEFAKAIKGVVDALATVAGLALDKIAAVTDTQLQIAGASLTSLATWAREMMLDWLTIMPDAKVRAEFVGQLQEFATMIKSAADIVKSADIGDLSKMVVLQVTSFGPVKDSLGRMQQLTTEIVQAWAKGAGDATARAQWITDLKDFADTMGAAADILKIAAIGEIKAALEYNADALTDVLTRLRDQLQPAMAAIVVAWTLTNEQAAVATERMQAFGNWIGAALSLAKLADVGKLVGEVELDVIEIRAVLKWVRDNLAPEMAMVADAWRVVSEEAERQTARMKEFGDWISASIGLAKLADVGTLNGEVELDVIELRAVLKWVRDRLAPEMVMVADAWATASKEAERQTARMKEFSDWISASIGMAKLANVGTLVGEVELDVIEIRAVLKWVRDKLAPEMVAIAEAWGHTAESSKPIIEKMKAFGEFVAAAVNLAKSADLSELTTVTGVSGLAGKLEIVKTNILAMYGMLGDIAKDISVEEASARAALATALGSIGSGLGDFGGGIGGIMELVQSKLFGSDASRGGLGFTQRTKTNRADFFATQLTDTVKRAVGAVQDALDGISIQPNDPKVTALGQLGEAFGKLADGLTKLAEAKLPDAGQLAAIMGATGGASLALAGAAGGGGGAGPTVTGMGGGDMYIQYGNNVIVTDADDQQGLIEALKASIR